MPAQRLLVHAVARFAQPLAQEGHVPPVHRDLVHRHAGALRLDGPQLVEVVPRRLFHGRLHVVQESPHGLRCAGHPPPQHESREAGEVVQAGELAPELHDLVEDVQVPRCPAIQVPDVVAAARLFRLRVRHERVEVGVVEREEVPALGIARLPREVRLGQAEHLGRLERQPRLVVAQVARELLRQHRHALGNRLRAGAAIRRQRDAGVLERLDEVLAQLRLGGR